MRAVELWASVNADRTISVPLDIVAQVEGTDPVRVVVVVPDGDEDPAGAALAAGRFLRGYDPDDALYDDLPSG